MALAGCQIKVTGRVRCDARYTRFARRLRNLKPGCRFFREYTPGGRVTSPTFTLVNGLAGGRLALFHVDLYRLEREAELEDIGLDDLYRRDGVVAVEWFDRFPDVAPRDHLRVEISIDGDARRLHATANGARAAALLSAWERAA